MSQLGEVEVVGGRLVDGKVAGFAADNQSCGAVTECHASADVGSRNEARQETADKCVAGADGVDQLVGVHRRHGIPARAAAAAN